MLGIIINYFWVVEEKNLLGIGMYIFNYIVLRGRMLVFVFLIFLLIMDGVLLWILFLKLSLENKSRCLFLGLVYMGIEWNILVYN